MHKHCCDVTGHEYECNDDCECICGLPMNGNDHSDCPVELRACPEHVAQNGLTAEVEPGAVEIDFSILSPERQQSPPHCQCGCANIEPGASVGFCLWCDHRYLDYTREIESRHFAYDCPSAPEKLKESEKAWLAKRRGKIKIR